METWLESIVAGLGATGSRIVRGKNRVSFVSFFVATSRGKSVAEVGGIRALGRRKRMEADSPFRIVRSLVSFFTSFAFSFESIHSDSDPCFRQ